MVVMVTAPPSPSVTLLPIFATIKYRIVTAVGRKTLRNINLSRILKHILEALESQPVHLVTFTCEILLSCTEEFQGIRFFL